jgi:hypothetical protein
LSCAIISCPLFGGDVPSARAPGQRNIAVGGGGISSPGGKLCPKIRAGTSPAQLYAVIKAAVFEAREPELIPIRRNPGLRTAEPNDEDSR